MCDVGPLLSGAYCLHNVIHQAHIQDFTMCGEDKDVTAHSFPFFISRHCPCSCLIQLGVWGHCTVIPHNSSSQQFRADRGRYTHFGAFREKITRDSPHKFCTEFCLKDCRRSNVLRQNYTSLLEVIPVPDHGMSVEVKEGKQLNISLGSLV